MPKQRGDSAVPKTVTHPEHHHTLNHLHHVSSFWATLAAWGSEAYAQSSHCQRDLASLAKKAVIRLDTSVKRAVCRRCNVPAIEGLTLTTRNKASGPHGHVVQNKCSVCHSTRRLPAPYPVLPSKRLPQRQRRKVGRVVKSLLRDQPPGAKSAKLSRKQRSDARKQRHPSPIPQPQAPARTRINLPPFSDRVQGSGWDHGLSSAPFLHQASRSRGDHMVVRGIGKNGAVGSSVV